MTGIDYGLVVVNPPAAEPVSLARVRAHLQQDLTDDDDEIGVLLTAARQRIEQETNRALVSQSLKLVLDRFPAAVDCGADAPVWAVRLPRGVVSAVSEVAYYDAAGTRTTLTATTDYLTHLSRSPALVYPAPGKVWPAVQYGRLGAVEVTYVAGYGAAADVPADLVAAILLTVRYWYDNRGGDADPFTLGIPMGAERIVNGYRLPEYR